MWWHIFWLFVGLSMGDSIWHTCWQIIGHSIWPSKNSIRDVIWHSLPFLGSLCGILCSIFPGIWSDILSGIRSDIISYLDILPDSSFDIINILPAFYLCVWCAPCKFASSLEASGPIPVGCVEIYIYIYRAHAMCSPLRISGVESIHHRRMNNFLWRF